MRGCPTTAGAGSRDCAATSWPGSCGISEPYLTRLEQGVDQHPSPQVLRALARALELDDDACAHLFALAAPTPGPARPAETEVAPDVHQLLDAWAGTPAYVRDRRFDVLAANKWARALAPMYEPGHNLARDMFLDPSARRLFPDWPEIAAQTAAALRAEAAPRDPRVGGWSPSWRRTRTSAACGPGTTRGPPATSSNASRTRPSASWRCVGRRSPSGAPSSR